MTTSATATRLSDRAHRIVFELSLRDGQWVDVVDICTRLGLTSHQVRSALKELISAGVATRERRREASDFGCLRTHRTFFRLTDEDPSEAPA